MELMIYADNGNLFTENINTISKSIESMLEVNKYVGTELKTERK